MSTAPETADPSTPARRGRADAVCGAVVVLAGLVLLVAARGIGEAQGPAIGIGPGTLPTVLAAGLVVAGVLLVVSGVRRARATQATTTDDPGTAERVAEVMEADDPPVPLRRLGLMVALVVAYALAFIPLGYVWSTAAYLMATVTLIDRDRWRRNLAFAVVFAFVVYYGFTQLLAVELPLGPFLLPGA